MAELYYAAFRPQDVDDAKRGHPDVDLRDYAAARGLEFLDHGNPGGFRAALPSQEHLQSNVLRGVLPGGAYGVMAHEGLEVGYTSDSWDWGGELFGARVRVKGGWKVFLGDAPTAWVRVPCTVAGVRVPETGGTHPYMRIDTRRSSPPFSFTNRTKLDDYGASGWSMWCEPEPAPETVERIVAEPVAELLRRHSEDGLFQIVVWWGTLIVRRNGYLDAADLDKLAEAATTLAERLRRVCAELAEPQRFDAELPPMPSDARELPAGFYPGGAWGKWAVETAERHALLIENQVAYHRAFPRVPVPGTAYVVLRGLVPHVGRGRLVVHRERDAARPAVVISAPAGAAPTPPGGVLYPDHGARLEIAADLLAVWSTTAWTGDVVVDDIDAFCRAAATVMGQGGTTGSGKG